MSSRVEFEKRKVCSCLEEIVVFGKLGVCLYTEIQNPKHDMFYGECLDLIVEILGQQRFQVLFWFWG